ncbi:MAG: DUF3108 domain-containing protein [Pseudomonadota bacterium]
MRPSIRQSRLLLLIFASLIASVAPAQELAPHEARYKIKAGFASGELTTRLDLVDGAFVAQHTADPRGLAGLVAGGQIVEQSTFVVRDNAVHVLTYTSNDSLSRDKGNTSLSFDWKAKKVSGAVTPEGGASQPVDLSLADPLHDRLSIQYQLMLDLLRDTPATTYRLFDADGNKTLTITRVGNRTIKVGRTRYDAIGIQHQAEGSSRTTLMWCVPSLGYLPAMIEQRRKGKLKVRVSLLSYDALPMEDVSALPPSEVSAS